MDVWKKKKALSSLKAPLHVYSLEYKTILLKGLLKISFDRIIRIKQRTFSLIKNLHTFIFNPFSWKACATEILTNHNKTSAICYNWLLVRISIGLAFHWHRKTFVWKIKFSYCPKNVPDKSWKKIIHDNNVHQQRNTKITDSYHV